MCFVYLIYELFMQPNGMHIICCLSDFWLKLFIGPRGLSIKVAAQRAEQKQRIWGPKAAWIVGIPRTYHFVILGEGQQQRWRWFWVGASYQQDSQPKNSFTVALRPHHCISWEACRAWRSCCVVILQVAHAWLKVMCCHTTRFLVEQ